MKKFFFISYLVLFISLLSFPPVFAQVPPLTPEEEAELEKAEECKEALLEWLPSEGPLPKECKPDAAADIEGEDYSVDGVRGMANNLIVVVFIGLGVFGVHNMVANGFKMMANSGNDAKVKEALKGIGWNAAALVGLGAGYAVYQGLVNFIFGLT